MAIQFDCVACGKRIEIDDTWGGRLVECPYCRDTITAPAFSSGVVPASPSNTATPASPEFASAAGSGAEHRDSPMGTPGQHASNQNTYDTTSYSAPWSQPSAPRTNATNKLAIVALVLACVSVLFGIGAMIPVVGAIAKNLGTDTTPEAVNAFVEQAVSEQAPWITKASLLLLAGFGVWVAGLVCALLAVRHKSLRGVSIAALVVLGFPIGLFLLSLACSP